MGHVNDIQGMIQPMTHGGDIHYMTAHPPHASWTVQLYLVGCEHGMLTFPNLTQPNPAQGHKCS